MKYYVYSYQWKNSVSGDICWTTELTSVEKITHVYELLIESFGCRVNITHIEEISKEEFIEAVEKGII